MSDIVVVDEKMRTAMKPWKGGDNGGVNLGNGKRKKKQFHGSKAAVMEMGNERESPTKEDQG